MTTITLIFAVVLLSLLYSYSQQLIYIERLENLNELELSIDELLPIAGAEENKKRLLLTYYDSFILRKNTVLLRKTIQSMNQWELFQQAAHTKRVLETLAVNRKGKYEQTPVKIQYVKEVINEIITNSKKYNGYIPKIYLKRLEYILENLESNKFFSLLIY